MALLPYALTRSVLFAMDAEEAHELTLRTLAATQHNALRWGWASAGVENPCVLAGMRLRNRVGLAAGLDKNAHCIDAFGAMGFGFVEVGTVTPLAQPGNPKPRLFRLPQARALINRFGFNNDGLDAFIAHVQRSRWAQERSAGQPSALHVGLNIGKNAATPIERAADDYRLGLTGVYAHADWVTVNISSPNTKNLRSLQSDAALDALLGTLSETRAQLAQRHGVQRPIFLKIAPDLDADQIGAIAQTLRRYGCDAQGQPNDQWGLIATNTTLSRSAVQGLAHADEAGGLSGAPVLALSNQVIAALRAQLGPRFAIIGVGGVMSGADAVSKVAAGADVVQIYSGLIYRGPGLVDECARALRDAGAAPHSATRTAQPAATLRRRC